MNLHEYQAKQLFAQYGLPVPSGVVCSSTTDVEESIDKLMSPPWIIKCQVHAGGRGNAGGVKLINNKHEARDFSIQWLGKRLVTLQTNANGQPVNKILIENVTPIDKELYFGATLDRCTQRIVFIASTQGGVDIEKVAQKTPGLIFKTILDPLTGPQLFQGRQLAYQLGLQGKQITQFITIFMGLAKLFLDKDLSLVEINPLAVTTTGDLLCLDAKLSIDNNALFRQKDLHAMYDITQEDQQEAHAAQIGLSYVSLDGNIGCLVNGAGLAMGTMDIVKLHGGSPANFLDVGGNATKERVSEAFKIILSDKKVKAIFVNIFGGIVRCDLIAEGIVSAVSEMALTIPVIVRLEGNNAKLATAILAKSDLNIIAAKSLTEGAQRAVAAAGGKT